MHATDKTRLRRPRLLKGSEPRKHGTIPATDKERADLLAVLKIRGAPILRSEGMVPTRAFSVAADRYLRRHEGFCFRFARQRGARHIPLEDLVQACRIGAMIALERFDPVKAGRFLSYARWWMQCETGKLLHQNECLVPVGPALKKTREAIEAAERKLLATAPADLSDEEVASELAIDVAAVREARHMYLGHAHRGVDDRSRAQRRSLDDARAAHDARASQLNAHAHLDAALAKLSPVQRLLLYQEFGVGTPVAGVAAPSTEGGRRSLRHAAMRRLRIELAHFADEDED